MKLAKKSKRRPCLPLFARLIWPCGDLTQHEILSEAICQFTLKRIFWLATPCGPICRDWNSISSIIYSSDGSGSGKGFTDWSGTEGECGICPTTRKETK